MNDITWFIDTLLNRYQAPKNKGLIEDIESFFSGKSADFNSLYRDLVENYEYESFPGIAKIKKYYREGYTSSECFDVRGAVLEKAKDMTVERICRIIEWLGEKTERNSYENSFIAIFSDLYYHYTGLINDQGVPAHRAKPYCEKIKEAIYRGEKISAKLPPLDMPEINTDRSNRTQKFSDALPLDIKR